MLCHKYKNDDLMCNTNISNRKPQLQIDRQKKIQIKINVEEPVRLDIAAL
jgi:hypothetical protein